LENWILLRGNFGILVKKTDKRLKIHKILRNLKKNPKKTKKVTPKTCKILKYKIIFFLDVKASIRCYVYGRLFNWKEQFPNFSCEERN